MLLAVRPDLFAHIAGVLQGQASLDPDGDSKLTGVWASTHGHKVSDGQVEHNAEITTMNMFAGQQGPVPLS